MGMTAPAFKYRLQPLLDGKLQRREDAERKVATSQNELQAEQQHLAELENRVGELTGRKSLFRGALLSGAAALSGHDAGFRRDHLRGLEQDMEAARKPVFPQNLAIARSRNGPTQRPRNLP